MWLLVCGNDTYMAGVYRENASKAFSKHVDSYFAKTIFSYNVSSCYLGKLIKR